PSAPRSTAAGFASNPRPAKGRSSSSSCRAPSTTRRFKEAPVQRLRVLIADDQEVVRRALSELVASVDDLELVGAVEDADPAVALAECEQPDVAVLDVKMPGGGARA